MKSGEMSETYRELTCFVIESYMGNMDRVFRGGYLDTIRSRRAQNTSYEGGDATLFLPGRQTLPSFI